MVIPRGRARLLYNGVLTVEQISYEEFMCSLDGEKEFLATLQSSAHGHGSRNFRLGGGPTFRKILKSKKKKDQKKG